jgi:hypothetical protein
MTKYILSWNDQDDPPHHDKEEFDTKEEAMERVDELLGEYFDELEWSLTQPEDKSKRDIRLRREGALAELRFHLNGMTENEVRFRIQQLEAKR